MTKYLLLSFILFCSIRCLAQNFGDSTITIQRQHLYTVPKPENLSIKGQIDAGRYYKRYKGAAAGTLVTSLFSPVIGLVPAILCASTSPKIENLGYPNEELFRQPEYFKAYTKKAKKIKQRKVWSNWGIGLGVNLVLIALISTR
ncbi:hypothetical protein [Dyadobacter luticola]|uniref:Uncharacterized protein n=1 Tax=Dyadobacter luticola TaxID=1979387 RepID=A0A5R9KS43_9BACT|nr:hypothetical protein [Dyadobacter luticola]TLU98949.1 hypothetical protein FEN17_20380 [Dyadobacter luticola]